MAADRQGNGEAAAAAWDAQVMPSWVGSHGATAAAGQGQGQAQGMSAQQAGIEDGQGLDDLGSLFKAFLQETADQDEAQVQAAAAAAACAHAHPGPGAATGAGEAAVCGAASAQEAGCGHSNGMAVKPCNAHNASVLVTEESVAGPAAEDSAAAAAAAAPAAVAAAAAAAGAPPQCLEVDLQAMVGAEDSFEQLLLNDDDLSSWLDG